MSDAESIVLAAGIGAVAAIIGALITALLAQRETQRSRAQEALDWMTGDSQRRNVGIATIESSWEPRWRRRKFRRLVTPVLCGTALYLISASNQKDAPHEVHNLDRVMALLMTSSRKERQDFHDAYHEVRCAIRRSRRKYGQMPLNQRVDLKDTGLFIDVQKLNNWERQLRRLGVR
jgi:hypothetical protein